MGFIRKSSVVTANPPARRRAPVAPPDPGVTHEPIIATICVDICVLDANRMLDAAMRAALFSGMTEADASALFIKGEGETEVHVDVGACLTKILDSVRQDLIDKTACEVSEVQVFLEPVLLKTEEAPAD